MAIDDPASTGIGFLGRQGYYCIRAFGDGLVALIVVDIRRGIARVGRVYSDVG